ncbi:MAG: prolipoprotein diacylglyceryl transferase, partial [Clostridiales bacterium]|nr:prolipoprotein diacylglyceryl transferase [Candidatus Blautia equi]
YWITQWRQIAADPGFLMETMGFGFTVYGGVIGGILLGFLYCRKRGLKFLQFFDLIMPSVALAQGFGRIGCFLAGCCYGKESASGWTVTFQHSDMAPNGVPLIPTQIYSSLFDFALALLLIYLAERIRRDGVIAGLYLCFYSAGRFIIEFFRGDMERGQIGILSTSQFLAVFSLAAGVLLLVVLCGKRKKETV